MLKTVNEQVQQMGNKKQREDTIARLISYERTTITQQQV